MAVRKDKKKRIHPLRGKSNGQFEKLLVDGSFFG